MEYYAPHFASSPSPEFTAKLREAVVHDIAREIVIQNADFSWETEDYGSDLAAINPSFGENRRDHRWHYEFAIVEGTPFDIDEALTPNDGSRAVHFSC